MASKLLEVWRIVASFDAMSQNIRPTYVELGSRKMYDRDLINYSERARCSAVKSSGKRSIRHRTCSWPSVEDSLATVATRRPQFHRHQFLGRVTESAWPVVFGDCGPAVPTDESPPGGSVLSGDADLPGRYVIPGGTDMSGGSDVPDEYTSPGGSNTFRPFPAVRLWTAVTTRPAVPTSESTGSARPRKLSSCNT